MASPASRTRHRPRNLFAQSAQANYFIKLNASIDLCEAAAAQGITPPVVVTGSLEDGTDILVQTFVKGRMPSWPDFQSRLQQFAEIVKITHASPKIKAKLNKSHAVQLAEAGVAALKLVSSKWQHQRNHVSPELAASVDRMLASLAAEIDTVSDTQLVNSHNDMGNGNWLISDSDSVYLLDLDSMTIDDPAHDMGSLLWWYYPPAMRGEFLNIAGYAHDAVFKNRMRIRMTLHSLNILLPRKDSFDKFDAAAFESMLDDVTAVFEARENPRGYDD